MKRSAPTKTTLGLAAIASLTLSAVAVLPAAADGGSDGQAGMAQMHDRMMGHSPRMDRMHDRMMEQNPGMVQMHELMMQGNPGMAQMHGRMMSGHAHTEGR